MLPESRLQSFGQKTGQYDTGGRQRTECEEWSSKCCQSYDYVLLEMKLSRQIFVGDCEEGPLCSFVYIFRDDRLEGDEGIWLSSYSLLHMCQLSIKHISSPESRLCSEIGKHNNKIISPWLRRFVRPKQQKYYSWNIFLFTNLTVLPAQTNILFFPSSHVSFLTILKEMGCQQK